MALVYYYDDERRLCVTATMGYGIKHTIIWYLDTYHTYYLKILKKNK